jgi:hypothetical protein
MRNYNSNFIFYLSQSKALIGGGAHNLKAKFNPTLIAYGVVEETWDVCNSKGNCFYSWEVMKDWFRLEEVEQCIYERTILLHGQFPLWLHTFVFEKKIYTLTI